jgi:hypothetical protein
MQALPSNEFNRMDGRLEEVVYGLPVRCDNFGGGFNYEVHHG